VLKDSLTTI